MACKCYQKSSLVATTIRDLAVDVGDYVQFDVNRVHTGVSISHAEGGSVIRLNSPGLYMLTFDGDFTIGTSGAVTVQLYNKGVMVQGAENTAQAVANVPYGIHFTTIINVLPNCCAVDNTSALQIQVSAAGEFNNASITVVKLAQAIFEMKTVL